MTMRSGIRSRSLKTWRGSRGSRGSRASRKRGMLLLRRFVLTRPAAARHRSYLRFENITMVPIQTKLVDTSLITKDELRWINEYNQTCLQRVGPLLGDVERKWLAKECAPLVVA